MFGRSPGPASESFAAQDEDSKRDDPRAVWLRSLAWHQTQEGLWSGHVVETLTGRYRAMSLDQAFDVALRRSIIDKAFRVENAGGSVRVSLQWRPVAPQDRPELEAAGPGESGAGGRRAWSGAARRAREHPSGRAPSHD